MPQRKIIMITVACLLSACATVQPSTEDACAMADGEVTFQNLLKNSVASMYERCLSVIRDKAATELNP